MNLLTDMWLLATRNITMTALCFVYWLAVIHWPLVGLLFLAAWFHLSSAIISNGDLLLRKTRAGKTIWLFTIGMFAGLLLYAVLKVSIEGPAAAAKEPDVFDYLDVLSFLSASLVGVYYIGISAWSAQPNLTYFECVDAFHGTLHTSEAGKPAIAIGLLYAIGSHVPDADWVLAISILASCAWVMRYMLGTPPERKAKTAYKAAEGAA